MQHLTQQAAVRALDRQAPGPLRQNLRFQTLWLGQAFSCTGVAVADVAYPLAILAVTGSPALAGLFAAVQATGMLLAGLPAGQLADRYDRRLIVITSEGCRALVTGLVAAALALGWLSLPLLIGAALLLGVGSAVTGPARLLLVRAVVPDEQLASALTQDQVRTDGAQLVGPPLAGVLYAVRALGHAVPFLCTAGSFAASLVTALVIKVGPARPEAPDAGPRRRAGLLAGVAALWSDPVLRAIVLLVMVVNTIAAGLTLVTVVILRDQSVPPALIGVALTGAAAGGLAGAALVRPLHRLRPGVLLIAECVLLIPLVALLAVPLGPWWVGGLLFVSMLGTPALRVLIEVLIFRQAPAEQRGRVIAAVLTLFGLGLPVGAAASGLLLQCLPAQHAVLVLAAALGAGVLCCAGKRVLWRARWPA
jgi:predicted MFS family arabinose efflux permease